MGSHNHTIKKILNYDLKSKMGIKIKEWVVFNKLGDFYSLLKYTDDDFTPIGNLCYINENHKISLMKMNINMMMMSGPIP